VSDADDLTLYRPGEEFPGKIGNTVEESSPAWPVPKRAPKGSSNVLFYVLDDVGYGQLTPFGGLVEAPTLQRLADNGLRYTNMHTTALCSPSRSCIITGRNHHSNGMGSISEWSTGFPGYNGRVPREHGFLSEILRAEGYNTFAAGKWHLSVATEETPAGPFDTWPLGRGFERFYGFLPGETDQWYPDLISDNHAVDPPAAPEDGYHFSADLADTAIQFVGDAHVNAPDKPFFLYLCPGAGHAPHHVFSEWADRYAGKFDMGWDEYRQIVCENQKRMGIIPADTDLSPRDPDVPEWDSLSEKEKRLYARMMEVFAGYVTYTEHQIGRVLDFLESIDELDNTLIMFVSDNGASPEGGVGGSLNEFHFFNFADEDIDATLARIDDLGSPNSYGHYAWGWAHAGNTPFKRWKKEIYRGGASDAFVVSWPAGIEAKGEIRHQFGHIIDMVPTVLDALDIEPPATLNGYEQQPIEGVSFAHTFEDADAETAHLTQYYEMFGGRSIYHDGWRAICGWPGPNFAEAAKKGHQDADPITPADLAELDETGWELYHVDSDFSETHDVAADHPDKLKELIQLWWEEARTYNVLPLDGTISQRFATPRPSELGSGDRLVFFPGSPVFTLGQPKVFNRDYVISADLVVPDEGAEGAIVATGGGTGGYSLYVKDGRLGYVYNYLDIAYFTIAANADLPTGDVNVMLEFEKTGDADIRAGKGAPGTATLIQNGEVVGSVDMDVTVPLIFSAEGMTVGRDYGDSVSKAIYQPPFDFTGTVKQVTFDLSGDAIEDAEAERRRAMSKQ
jgi:arylsulfatase A-like enzyme